MKNQALFSSKDKSEKLKCCLLQFLFGVLRVKVSLIILEFIHNISRKHLRRASASYHMV